MVCNFYWLNYLFICEQIITQSTFPFTVERLLIYEGPNALVNFNEIYVSLLILGEILKFLGLISFDTLPIVHLICLILNL